MLAGLVLVVTLANLLLDFLGHHVNGRVEVNFGILGEKVGAGNGKTHGAFELAIGGLGVVVVQADAGVDGEAVNVFKLVDAGEDVFLDGLGEGHVMRRENQFHMGNLRRK